MRTGVRIFLQYQPQFPGLAQFKLNFVANDRLGLHRRDFQQVLRAFSCHHLHLIEIAFDFSPESRIGAEHVRRHATFGKSRPCNSHVFVGTFRYGSRRGDKLVRCYWKQPIGCFRVELEIHAALLRRNGIAQLSDVYKIPQLLCPAHVRFVQMNWPALEKYLAKRNVQDHQDVLKLAIARAVSIHGLMAFLRGTVGVKNAHRFLVPQCINEQIERSLKRSNLGS
jgi:hypothetical protein